MANDKSCGCMRHGLYLGFDQSECRYPALDSLVQELVDAYSAADHKLERHSFMMSPHNWETEKVRDDLQKALDAAAKLGYTPTGEESYGQE